MGPDRCMNDQDGVHVRAQPTLAPTPNDSRGLYRKVGRDKNRATVNRPSPIRKPVTVHSPLHLRERYSPTQLPSPPAPPALSHKRRGVNGYCGVVFNKITPIHYDYTSWLRSRNHIGDIYNLNMFIIITLRRCYCACSIDWHQDCNGH